jgi:hypothetical protein
MNTLYSNVGEMQILYIFNANNLYYNTNTLYSNVGEI